MNGKRPKPLALYVIWTGANDYIVPKPEDQATPSEVVANITQAVKSLYSLGARNFLIPNLPDLGLAPIVHGAESKFSQLTQSHNALLEKARRELALQFKDANVMIVDIYTVSQNLINLTSSAVSGPMLLFPPALAALTGGPDAAQCLFVDPTKCPDINPNGKLPQPFYFWDILHPTTLVHSYYGKAMFDKLKSK